MNVEQLREVRGVRPEYHVLSNEDSCIRGGCLVDVREDPHTIGVIPVMENVFQEISVGTRNLCEHIARDVFAAGRDVHLLGPQQLSLLNDARQFVEAVSEPQKRLNNQYLEPGFEITSKSVHTRLAQGLWGRGLCEGPFHRGIVARNGYIKCPNLVWCDLESSSHNQRQFNLFSAPSGAGQCLAQIFLLQVRIKFQDFARRIA